MWWWQKIVFNIFSKLRYFPKTQGRNLLLQLLKRGRGPRRLLKLLRRPPANKVNYLSRPEHCVMIWPARNPSPAPTMAPSKLAFPVVTKNNGAASICCEHRRTTRVGINNNMVLLVLDSKLNSSVTNPSFSFIFRLRHLGGISRILERCEHFFICLVT